jgi:hypothetical protein
MSINNPPLREDFGSNGWQSWFSQVMTALLGWKKTYTATKTHDFGSINAQVESTTTVTVTGARSGDAVLIRPTTAVNGIILDGTVTASDTVTIRAVNYSTGAIDPASQVYRVIVFQQ